MTLIVRILADFLISSALIRLIRVISGESRLFSENSPHYTAVAVCRDHTETI